MRARMLMNDPPENIPSISGPRADPLKLQLRLTAAGWEVNRQLVRQVHHMAETKPFARPPVQFRSGIPFSFNGLFQFDSRMSSDKPAQAGQSVEFLQTRATRGHSCKPIPAGLFPVQIENELCFGSTTPRRWILDCRCRVIAGFVAVRLLVFPPHSLFLLLIVNQLEPDEEPNADQTCWVFRFQARAASNMHRVPLLALSTKPTIILVNNFYENLLNKFKKSIKRLRMGIPMIEELFLASVGKGPNYGRISR
jgi:hypothetical protein